MSPEDTPPSTALTQMLEAISQLNDFLTPMLEAAIGHKAKCEAVGFSPAAAEQMAVEYYRMMVDVIRANLVKGR